MEGNCGRNAFKQTFQTVYQKFYGYAGIERVIERSCFSLFRDGFRAFLYGNRWTLLYVG